jgi:hypothetical protein
MGELLIRFVVGGAVVSLFAVIGDILKPKSFAGLFGAAPSVALATLSLTIAKDGVSYGATEGRSMIAGALAFFVYSAMVSWIIMRYGWKALPATLGAMPLWFGVTFAGWYFWLR